jgi:hypothetical protein
LRADLKATAPQNSSFDKLGMNFASRAGRNSLLTGQERTFQKVYGSERQEEEQQERERAPALI